MKRHMRRPPSARTRKTMTEHGDPDQGTHLYRNGSAEHIKHLMKDHGWTAARVREYFRTTCDPKWLEDIISEAER